MEFSTLAKGIEILNLFLKERAPLTAIQIASALQMPRSTTFKYLAVLKEHGLLENEQLSGKYKLGFRLLEFSSLIQSQNPLLDAALPYMRKLSNLTEETVFLSTLSNGKPHCLEIVEYKRGIVFSLRRGDQLPMNGGASTKVLVAFLSDKEIEDYTNRTEFVRYAKNTIIEAKKFRESLREISKAGFAYTDEEVTPGARGIAAPIFSEGGRPIAGLCLVGPVQRMQDKKIREVRKMVVSFAREISAELNKWRRD